MGITKVRKAVFLDRDGVINLLVPTFEDPRNSPQDCSEFRIYGSAIQAISALNKAGWLTVVVSNQPNVAKGKSSFQDHEEINQKMKKNLREGGAFLDDVFYCLHHPDPKQVTRPDMLKDCSCRKPRPGLILKAAEKWNIDLSKSWMIGDNISDIEAGQRAGCQTIMVKDGLKYENIHRLCRS